MDGWARLGPQMSSCYRPPLHRGGNGGAPSYTGLMIHSLCTCHFTKPPSTIPASTHNGPEHVLCALRSLLATREVKYSDKTFRLVHFLKNAQLLWGNNVLLQWNKLLNGWRLGCDVNSWNRGSRGRWEREDGSSGSFRPVDHSPGICRGCTGASGPAGPRVLLSKWRESMMPVKGWRALETQLRFCHRFSTNFSFVSVSLGLLFWSSSS